MARVSALAPLRHRPFRYLVAGRIVTRLGSAMAPIALAFAVLDRTGSVTALGLVVAANSLTSVAFLLFGGVVADRFPRQLVVVGSSVLAGAAQVVAAAVVLRGTASVPLLAGLAATNGLAASFALPATAALLPQTVPEHLRRPANVVNRLGNNSATIGGAALGGFLVAAFGPGWGLAVDGLSFLASAGCFALIRIPRPRRSAESAGTLSQLRDGWREFTARSWVWGIVLAFCVVNAALVGALQVLGPAVADHTIGRRVWGLVLATLTAGMVAGAAVALRLRVRRLLLVGTACVGTTVLVPAALGVAPYLPVLVAAAFLSGIGIEQFALAWDTSLQDQVPADRLARVYSYDALGSMLAIPLGEASAGPVATAVGTRPALLGAAGLITLAILGALLNPQVRALQHPHRQPA